MASNHSARSEVLAWLEGHEAEMFSLLEKVVNADSGSRDEAGLATVARHFEEALQGSGLQTRLYPQPGYGTCLVAAVQGEAGPSRDHYLLMGHMDTVFPKGTAAARPYSVTDGMAHGPGVADMKSGLVMNTFIAKAFAELKISTRPIQVLYTCDEEIASPASRTLITEMARHARAVFNAEPGRVSGNFVSERKGAFFIDFEVTGIPAHSGVNHDKGRSAIEALARKIIELHALTDPATGVTANVGTVHGGQSINTVAPYVKAQLDIRFTHHVDKERLYRRISDIIHHVHVDGTAAKITHESNFLPLFPTKASEQVIEAYRACAHSLGLMIEGEPTGGSADSGFALAAGAPTVCGTGPVGGNAHTPEEYCDLSTFVPRAQAVAATILALENA
ncbi:M20 family metallopeptidase [Rhodoligotrophos ferricapiens]|uniref:M20 family metallopeptidase n=1 Tax=Rhodoligotrophos ferricapiens TaxID=3069264 RepID=UPI00315D5EDA